MSTLLVQITTPKSPSVVREHRPAPSDCVDLRSSFGPTQLLLLRTEDLSEGKFSFLVIYAIHSNPGDNRLLNIIKQRTEDVDLKLYALSFLRESVRAVALSRRVYPPPRSLPPSFDSPDAKRCDTSGCI